MDKIKLKNFVENNPTLVKIKSTRYDGLYLLKYTNKVFHDNLFNVRNNIEYFI